MIIQHIALSKSFVQKALECLNDAAAVSLCTLPHPAHQDLNRRPQAHENSACRLLHEWLLLLLLLLLLLCNFASTSCNIVLPMVVVVAGVVVVALVQRNSYAIL